MKLPIIYKHTAKAIKRGCSPDRLYLVVAQDATWLIAWKCDQSCGCDPRPPGSEYECGHKQAPPGKWFHPAFKRPMTVRELLTRGNIMKGRNGSDPTAYFRPDSLYEVLP